MTTTTTDTQNDAYAGVYGIDVPGTNKTLSALTRDWFNASDAYTEQMNDIRHDMGHIKDGNILAAVAVDQHISLALVLEGAETATDIIEYAQQELPAMINHAWIVSDYYNERMGMNRVHAGSVFEMVYERDGIQFLGTMLLQLLNIAERKNCVAKGVAYEGPAIINSADLIEYAESLRDEYELNFCYTGHENQPKKKARKKR